MINIAFLVTSISLMVYSNLMVNLEPWCMRV